MNSILSEKGLSPVIASILMIVVVVALIIITFGFTTGMMAGTSTTATEAGALLTSATATGLIDGTYDATAPGDIVYVRLTGDVETAIDAVFVDGFRISCTGVTLTESSSTDSLTDTECSGLDFNRNQVIVVTGSNNFRLTGRT
ncbi:MAG: hypothetical protein GOV15_02800 [Candidatus Diapherotrites archaeon]|nr:hypothetical protein [Candidatus Diapherotrites archaeon]